MKEEVEKEDSTEINKSKEEAELPKETDFTKFNFIKLGNLSNINGFSVLEECFSEHEKLQLKDLGSYKKLYIMKLLKFYVILTVFGFYMTHFVGYKGGITLPNKDMHDLILKHH